MKKFCFLVLSVLLFGVLNLNAAEQMLPFSGGQTWSCDQSNYDDSKNVWGCYCYNDANGDGIKKCTIREGAIDENEDGLLNCSDLNSDWKMQWSNPTHREGSKLDFAWDFNMGSTTDLGLPVLAPAAGTVVYARNSNSAWGNVVIINYGDGTYGKLAHLQKIDACEGQKLSQGQQVGTCGGTPYWPSHIHYQTQKTGELNGVSERSTFLDTEETSRIPKEGGYYTSLNTYNPYSLFRIGKFVNGWRLEEFNVTYSSFVPFSRPFAMTYFHHGGLTALGHPTTAVYQASVYDLSGYTPLGVVSLPWIQDVTNISGGEAWLTLVMNPYVENSRMGHAGQNINGVVYPIHGQIRNYWRAHYSDYGPPASNELKWPDLQTGPYVIQLFEKGQGQYFRIAYDTRDGSFNDAETLSVSLSDFRLESTWKNIGCPNGRYGVGGVEAPPSEIYEFGQAVSCGGMEDVDPWDYINQKSTFYNSDDRAYVWVELLNLYESVNLKWKWFDPSGNFATEYDLNTGYPSDGYNEWDHRGAYLNLTDGLMYGVWEVRVYVNDVLETSVPFELAVNLSAPVNVNATIVSGSQINVTWSLVDKANSYIIYRNSVLLFSGDGIGYIDNDIVQGETYSYKVKAANGSYTSSFSAEVSVIIPLPDPESEVLGIPSNLYIME